MNIYARFFDRDVLVYSVEELINFLSTIPDITITPQLENDIRVYVDSDICYPKRYKIRPRVYFILIKTNAETMAAFKANHKNASVNMRDSQSDNVAVKDAKQTMLRREQPGWYRGSLLFKRVLPIPGTTKFRYQDAQFTAMVKANSPADCYQRLVDHLKSRADIDLRSQFPSVKGQNFRHTYCGDFTAEELLSETNVPKE